MGYETLLSIESAEGARVLFEAHNGAPLFWYCLLDNRAIEDAAVEKENEEREAREALA